MPLYHGLQRKQIGNTVIHEEYLPVTCLLYTSFADGKSIEELIPNLYRKGKKDKARLFSHLEYKGTPWVTRTSRQMCIRDR